MAKILVVDDDQVLCEMFTDGLGRIGHDAVSVTTLAEAKKRAFAEDFELIFLDVQMPDGNGLMELPELKKAPSEPEVIIITGQGDPDGAERAIKSGAWDYLEKTTAIKEMILPLARVLQYQKAKKAAARNTISLQRRSIIGSSRQLTKCLDQVAKMSVCDASVLVTGETGVGKELFAKVIHENSKRASNNFVIVDCAALPETLVESTLFGHEKGSFTGADKRKSGLIAQADDGTLFLDEVGELSLGVQKKFLRALQEHQFRPVGSNVEVFSNFRLITATNRDLDIMVRESTFRADLLFRIKAMSIELPPLRGRHGDIKEISIHYLSRLSQKYGIDPKGFAPDFFSAIISYHWPGNVRELINTLETTLNNALYEPILYSRHLPDNIRIHLLRSSVGKKEAPFKAKPEETTVSVEESDQALPVFKQYRDQALALAEKEYFQRLIRQTRGNIKEACKLSGLGRTRLYTLMKKHNISRLGWTS
ncbi:MAG: sigma-54-dependent Fis family transcriptional regulator [Desulfobulbaceae bacterium]|nr:sigma-54-dependent Fis family transcriptional regulator [Desulfobulbaceae bacterium]